MNQAANTQYAKTLGSIAFAKGIKAAPSLDADFVAMLNGREVGDKRTNKEIKAWISGWHQANAA